MARSKRIPTAEELVSRATWEELLDDLVSPEAPADEYYKLAQEKIRAYVKDLESQVTDLDRALDYAYRDLDAAYRDISAYETFKED